MQLSASNGHWEKPANAQEAGASQSLLRKEPLEWNVGLLLRTSPRVAGSKTKAALVVKQHWRFLWEINHTQNFQKDLLAMDHRGGFSAVARQVWNLL